MITSLTLSKGANGGYYTSLMGDKVNVKNVGTLTGSAKLGLSKTSDDSAAAVFDIMQTSINSGLNIDVAGNDNNTRFSGYNINATFAAENNYGYNVELNTINSSFDFSKTSSGAQISTTENSMFNIVQLGGGKNVVHQETIDGAMTASGESETRQFNNLVVDSGFSNTFLSSKASQTKFETTTSSRGAFIQGGYGNDVFNISGSYGVFNGVGGNNIFVTKESSGLYGNKKGSFSNVIFGGTGTNTYNDFGLQNMYHGAYALGLVNGADTIRLNGSYGIARIDTQNDTSPKSDIFINGDMNMAFTGEEATINGDTINYYDVLKGGYFSEGNIWTLEDFYSSEESPNGYAAQLGYSLLEKIMR